MELYPIDRRIGLVVPKHEILMAKITHPFECPDPDTFFLKSALGYFGSPGDPIPNTPDSPGESYIRDLFKTYLFSLGIADKDVPVVEAALHPLAFPWTTRKFGGNRLNWFTISQARETLLDNELCFSLTIGESLEKMDISFAVLVGMGV